MSVTTQIQVILVTCKSFNKIEVLNMEHWKEIYQHLKLQVK